MRVAVALVLSAAFGLARAADSGLSFTDAKAVWEASKDRKEYLAYASQFLQFISHSRSDNLNGCYALGKDPLELMLVVGHRDSEQYVVVEVLSNAESEKVQCLRKSYSGLPMKAPPFFPFVLRMGVG